MLYTSERTFTKRDSSFAVTWSSFYGPENRPLDGPQEGVVRQREEYQRRRDALCHSFTAAGWEVPDAKGTMFVWARTPRGWEDDEAFVTELFTRTGILLSLIHI